MNTKFLQFGRSDQHKKQHPLIIAGAKLLDEKKPGWEQLVELKKIDLGYSVMEMVYGSNNSGYEKLGLECGDTWGFRVAMNHGFIVYDAGLLFFEDPEGSDGICEDHDLHKKLWKEQVEIRLEKNLMTQTKEKNDDQ